MKSLHQSLSLSKDAGRGLFKWAVCLQGLLIVPLLAWLGVWQLERKTAKEAVLAQWQSAGEVKPFAPHTATVFAQVQVAGHLDVQRWFLLDNQIRAGVVGYEVIGLLRPDSGGRPLLITLGWVKASPDRSRLPDIHLPSAHLQLVVRLDHPTAGLQLATPVWQQRWPEVVQQVELARFATRYGESLESWLLRPEVEVLTGQPSSWQPVVMPPQRHMGYAVQWFALALAWTLMTGWLWRTTR